MRTRKVETPKRASVRCWRRPITNFADDGVDDVGARARGSPLGLLAIFHLDDSGFSIEGDDAIVEGGSELPAEGPLLSTHDVGRRDE
jgi:hypothetical protein